MTATAAALGVVFAASVSIDTPANARTMPARPPGISAAPPTATVDTVPRLLLDFALVAGVVAVAAITVWEVDVIGIERRKERLRASLAWDSAIRVRDSICSAYGNRLIGIDALSESLVVVDIRGNEITQRLIPTSCIMDVELLVDTVAATTMRKDGDKGMAALRGLFFEGLEAIVGAQTAGSTGAATNTITSVRLVITVADLALPLIDFTLEASPSGVSRGREWVGRIKALRELSEHPGDAKPRAPLIDASSGNMPFFVPT